MTGDDRTRPTLTFHPDTGEYTTRLDSRSVVLTIALSLAILQGVDVTEIEPIAHSVDPDCVEALVAELSAGRLALEGQVAFEHEGYRLAIDGDGVLHVGPPDRR